MPRLILLCGPSGSGKSTYRSRILEASPEIAVLSGDDILEEWARQSGMTYQESYLAHRQQSLEELYRRLQAATKAGRDILWDQTNLTEEVRAGVLARISDDYDKIAIAFDAPLSVLLHRVYERELSGMKAVPEDVVRAQHAGFTVPHFDEGFDEVFKITAPGENLERVA